jgi:hypothetical protein|tara:strand:+ start:176 stop:301 length:126 start_codon:yes stop_codon:yes gene_type:complete
MLFRDDALTYQCEISEDENNELVDDNRIIPHHVQVEIYKKR